MREAYIARTSSIGARSKSTNVEVKASNNFADERNGLCGFRAPFGIGFF